MSYLCVYVSTCLGIRSVVGTRELMELKSRNLLCLTVTYDSALSGFQVHLCFLKKLINVEMCQGIFMNIAAAQTMLSTHLALRSYYLVKDS